MRNFVIVFSIIGALLVSAQGDHAVAQQERQVDEHPVIKPFPGFVFDPGESEHKDFNVYEFPVYDPKADDTVDKKIKGEYWNLYYECFDAEGNIREDISQFEVAENFKRAALEKGGKILYDDAEDGEITFTIPLESGNTLWGHLRVHWSAQYYITLVEEEAMVQKLTFGAEEIKRKLDEKGHVAIYGIHFDIDKADLKPEAADQLQEMVKLMLAYPDLRIEIEGHTDSTGTPEHNMNLSQRRADTVRNYLLLFGIDEARITTKGYGQTKPVASNDTDDGRALNRRVELVKK